MINTLVKNQPSQRLKHLRLNQEELHHISHQVLAALKTSAGDTRGN
jgi:FMN-dependent NADH-azoreductase